MLFKFNMSSFKNIVDEIIYKHTDKKLNGVRHAQSWKQRNQ